MLWGDAGGKPWVEPQPQVPTTVSCLSRDGDGNLFQRDKSVLQALFGCSDDKKSGEDR